MLSQNAIEFGDLVEQEIGNGVVFMFGDTKRVTGNARVDVDALPASYWVDTNDRVHGFDQLATDVEASRARSLRLPIAQPHCAEL
jgi:hypothetical protein